MVTSLLTRTIRPSHAAGFARNASESANPHLWKGLVGAWVPALGVTGNKLFDVSGRGNHGVISGHTWEANTLSFLSSGNIDLSGILNLTSQDYTFAFKIKKASGSAGSQYFFDTSSGRLVIGFGQGAVPDNLSFFDGAWKSFGIFPSNEMRSGAITLNSISSEAKGFLDGIQLGSTESYTGKNISSNTRLMSHNNGALNRLTATIDYVYLYNRVLSPTQIKQLHIDPLAPLRLKDRFSILQPSLTVSPSVLSISASLLASVLKIDVATLPSVLSVSALVLTPIAGEVITASPDTLPISVLVLTPTDITDNKTACMNTRTLAVTEYINFNYNSYTFFNGKYIALNKTGIFELGGNDDNSVDIVASLKTGTIDTYSDNINRLRDGYVTFRSDGDILLKTVGNKINERSYPIANSKVDKIHERRIKGATNTSGSFERGIRDRYFSFELLNVDGSSMDIDKLRIAMEPIRKRR